MELFKLIGKIAIENDEAKKALDEVSDSGGKAESKLSRLSAGAAKVGKGIMTGLAVGATAVAGITTAAVNAFAEFEQLEGGAKLMFGEGFNYIAEQAKNAFATVQMSQNEYLEQANGFAVGLKTALGGNEQAAAELAHKIIQAEADIVAATGESQENIQNAFNGIMKSNFQMLDNLKLGITPTKEGFQEVINKVNEWNAANGEATKYQIDNLADCQAALVDYIEMQGMSGYAAAEASGTIQGSLAMVKSSWENLLIGFADPTQNIGELINNLTTSVSAFAGNIIPVVTNVLSGIATAIPQLATVLTAELPNLFSQVLPGVISGATALVNGLVSALPGVFSAITSILPSLVDAVVQVINALVAALPTLLPAIINGIVSLITSIATALPGLLQSLVAALPGILQSVVDAITTNLPIILNAVTTLINELVAALPGMIQILVDALPGLLQNVITAITENLPIFIEAMISIINGIVEALPQIIETLTAALPGIIEMIVNALVENLPIYIEGIITMVNMILENLPVIIEAIVAMLPTIIQMLIEATFTLLPVLIEGAIQLTIGIVTALIENLPAILMALVQAIPATFQGVIDGIKNVFSPLTEWFSEAWNNIKTVFINAWNNIKTSVSTAINNVKTTITNVWNNIKTTTTNTWNNIKTTISNVWNNIKTAVSNAINNVKTTVSNVWDNIKSTTSSVYDSIKNTISNAWNSIKTTASNAVNNIKTAVVNAWNNMKSSISTVMNSIKTSVVNAWNNIKSAVSNAVNSLKTSIVNAWNNIKTSISNTVNNIKTKVTTGFNNIKTQVINTLNSLKTKIKTIGSDLITGLWNGINSKVDWIISKIGGFTDKVLNKMKSFFGIKSPSRRMRDEVGKQLAEGIAVGITENTEAVEGAATDMGKALLDAAQKKLDDYKVYNTLTLADEVAFWDSVRKQVTDGTEARISADKKYLEAKKSLNDQILAAEQDLQKSLDEIAKKVEDRAKSIMDSFKMFENVESEYSIQDLLNSKHKTDLFMSLDEQVKELEDWERQTERLAAKLGNSALYEEIYSMGFEALPQIRMLNSLTADELEKYAEVYAKKSEIAHRIAHEELDEESFKNAQTAYQTFADKCSEIGMDIDNSTAWVITSFENLKTKIGTNMDATVKTVKKALEEMTKAFDLFKIHYEGEAIFNFNGVNYSGAAPITIDWFAKAENSPRILDNPTVFGYSSKSGKLLGGGETGSEMIGGTGTIMNMIKSAVSEENSGLTDVLLKILKAILALDKNMGGNLREALEDTSLEINKREFARLVKAVN